MRKKFFRYIHLMLPDDLKFLPTLVRNFNKSENGFNAADHLFVTPHKRVYDAVSTYPNVEFSPVKNSDYASLINKYGDLCDWMFLHSMCKPENALKIKNRFLSKIIWRSWGGDAAFTDIYKPKAGRPLRNFIKKTIVWLWNNKIDRMYAIGVANTVDILDIRRRYGNKRMHILSYSSKESYDKLVRISQTPATKNDTLKIMLGHSGYPHDNHKGIIDKLCAYENHQFKVYIPLSYGKAEYIEEVKKYAAEKLKEKAVIVDTFMSYEEYALLLREMDVAILDAEMSYALGNIGILLFFRKKLFLNSNGIIKAAFDTDNIPYCSTNKIGEMSFEELSSPLTYPNVEEELSLQLHKHEYNMNNWKSLLNELEEYEVKK